MSSLSRRTAPRRRRTELIRRRRINAHADASRRTDASGRRIILATVQWIRVIVTSHSNSEIQKAMANKENVQLFDLTVKYTAHKNIEILVKFQLEILLLLYQKQMVCSFGPILQLTSY